MKDMMMQALAGDMNPQDLRRRMQWDEGATMRRRRAVLGVSLLGIAAMGIVSAFQIGAIRRLPDPPIRGLHSNKVNSSSTAFGFGMPDAPLAIGAHAANLALAAAGPPDRAERRPWLPLLATAVAATQVPVAAKYLFHQMPKVDRAWCPYCVLDALTHFAAFALTLPEAARALRALR